MIVVWRDGDMLVARATGEGAFEIPNGFPVKGYNKTDLERMISESPDGYVVIEDKELGIRPQ